MTTEQIDEARSDDERRRAVRERQRRRPYRRLAYAWEEAELQWLIAGSLAVSVAAVLGLTQADGLRTVQHLAMGAFALSIPRLCGSLGMVRRQRVFGYDDIDWLSLNRLVLAGPALAYLGMLLMMFGAGVLHGVLFVVSTGFAGYVFVIHALLTQAFAEESPGRYEGAGEPE